MKRTMIGAATLLMSLPLAGCAASSGSSIANDEVCATDDGAEVCAAVDTEQETVTATANGLHLELTTIDGDAINTFQGEGRLIQAGDEFEVVCYLDGTWGKFGVIVPEEFQIAEEPSDFATSRVNGENWLPVAYVLSRGFDDEDSVERELADALERKFDDIHTINSCEDSRVVLGSFQKAALEG